MGRIMKTVHYIFLFIMWAATSCFMTCGTPKTELEIDLSKVNKNMLKYRFEVLRTTHFPVDFQLSDVDGDGSDDLVQYLHAVNNPENQSLGYAPSRIILSSIDPYQDFFQLDLPNRYFDISNTTVDIDGDGAQELFIMERTADTVFIQLINHQRKILFRGVGAVKPKGSKEPWDCAIMLEKTMDFNKDGFTDLVLSYVTGYAYQPRGIRILDVHHNRFLLSYPGGFNLIHVLLSDINNDGAKEIVCSTSAPGNSGGVAVNHTDDFHCYLIIISQDGNGRSYVIGNNQYEDIQLCIEDIHNDGKQDIILASRSHGNPKQPSFVGIWDPFAQDFSIKRIVSNEIIDNIGFLDFDGDGKKDLVMGKTDGEILILNGNLDPVGRVMMNELLPSGVEVADVDGDMKEEIAVTGTYREKHVIVVFDHHLRLIAYLDAGYIFHMKNFIANRAFRNDKILAIHDYTSMQLTKLQKQNIRIPIQHFGDFGWGVMIGFVLISALSLFYFSNRNKHVDVHQIDQLISSLGVGAFILDSKGNLTNANTEIEELVGTSLKNKIGHHYKTLFYQDDLKEVYHLIEQSIVQDIPYHEKEIVLSKNGIVCDVMIRIAPYHKNKKGAPGRLILMENVTNIVQSNRLVAWASLAQRLAHEIKTPLSTVMLSSERLLMENSKKARKKETFDKYLSRITDQVDRLQRMTDSFVKFTHVEQARNECINVNELVRSVIEKNKPRIGRGVKLKLGLEEKIPFIFADRQQISIVLQNLIDNSLTAMQSEGSLIINSRLVQTLHKQAGETGVEYVQIQISDTGKGMSSEQQKQLFQPFFSNHSKGTGMGLVIAKKIVDDYHGTIKIESEPDIGTTVFIDLPAKRG